ncbi:MAG: hypothetical protein WCX13_04280, partial [Candidatus Hydrogenedentales bacterium]
MGGNPDVSHFVNVIGHLEPSPHCNRMRAPKSAVCVSKRYLAALLITMREIVEKNAVCSHLLENQLPGYSIVKKVQFFNTRGRSDIFDFPIERSAVSEHRADAAVFLLGKL